MSWDYNAATKEWPATDRPLSLQAQGMTDAELCHQLTKEQPNAECLMALQAEVCARVLQRLAMIEDRVYRLPLRLLPKED